VRTDRRASVGTPSVAIVHDYLTQRGGAERVVLLLAETFPDAPLHTSLYHPEGTYPEFAGLDIQTMPLNRFGILRRQHRLAFPVLAPSFSALRVDADVLLCSSSGWAHGTRTGGRKVVYCHAPARWLYQAERYLGTPQRSLGRPCGGNSPRIRADFLTRSARAMALRLLAPPLRRWDLHAATSADRYLTNSTIMADAIQAAYGREAEVLPPPPALTPDGPEREVFGLEPGYFLCIARLLPYKNVQVVAEAIRLVPGARLVIVGDGPARSDIESIAGPNVQFVSQVDDATLRWLYRNSVALVSASFEDYGLTPLEAACFGRPSVVLRAGGFLDTVVENRTGIFFDSLAPEDVAIAMKAATEQSWDQLSLQVHAEQFSAASFQRRIRQVVAEEDART
jgi:glycosyltransferase involved in cell wall biosynthesis